MPFTLSHPAAVLPLLRHPFVPAALVCGAVAPDAPYFLGATGVPVSAESWYEPFLNATTSHTLSGLTVSGSFALALLALYWLVRRPVLALLPAGLSPARTTENATAARRGDGLRRTGWVLLSVLIGILTHLLWDGFTHFDGYFVTHLGFLRAPLAGDLTVARAIQHLSTVGGLVAIAVYLWRRTRRSSGSPRSSGTAGPPALPVAARRGVVAVLVVATLAGAALSTRSREYYDADNLPMRDLLEALLSDWAKGGGLALACALTLYACAWWVRHFLRPAEPHAVTAR